MIGVRGDGAEAGGSCACRPRKRKPDGDASAYLHVFAYELKGGRRHRTTLTLRFRSFDRYEDNAREALRWRAAIHCLMEGRAVIAGSIAAPVSVSLPERRLLVLLNPKSGSGKARALFQKRVAPLLSEAEIPFDLQVTKHANFAREFVREQNLRAWKGLVSVGGDGILYEIVNGLFERPDWREILETVPLAVVPCGSGNGLARTLCHLYDEPYSPNPVMASALAIVKGKTSPMDIVRVETKTQILFSFLSVGWGLLSDIDIESEKLRAIGGQRFTVWSLARLIGLRTYRGKVYYLPTTTKITSPIRMQSLLPHSFSQDASLDCEECIRLGEECDDCRENTIISLDNMADNASKESRQRLDSWYSATSKKSTYYSTAGSDYLSIVDNKTGDKNSVCVYGPASRLPALTAPVPSEWKCIDGEFISVHAGYQPFLGEDVIFAPESRLDDGVIWLLIIRGGVTRTQLLSFLLGLARGAHANVSNNNSNSGLQLIPVSAFRIDPEPDPAHPAYITVDGEQVHYGPVQGEVCGIRAKIMVPAH